jgi:hypothetical protein
MTRSIFHRSALFAALALPACIVRGGDSSPLYRGPERPPEDVARLVGPIGTVDGKDVSGEGKAFSLAPGCHVVTLADKTGQINVIGGQGGYVAILPHATYAFRMQPAHTYEIEVRLNQQSGPSGTFDLRAWDRDGHGGSIQLSPATSTAEIDDCMKWRARE